VVLIVAITLLPCLQVTQEVVAEGPVKVLAEVLK